MKKGHVLTQGIIKATYKFHCPRENVYYHHDGQEIECLREVFKGVDGQDKYSGKFCAAIPLKFKAKIDGGCESFTVHFDELGRYLPPLLIPVG